MEFAFNAKQLIIDEHTGKVTHDPSKWVHFFANPNSTIVLEVIAAHYPRKPVGP